MAQQPETTHKPLTFANLGRIELGSGLAHPVASDAGINGASWRLRSELEADVTKMMKVPRLQVISRIPPETIQTIRKTARGCGGVSESPPWSSNDGTGTVGPQGRPGQVLPRRGIPPWHARTEGLRPFGTQQRFKSHASRDSGPMGAWPLPTGDSLVVPSRAQVNLLGPCDRSFQTTPLTMSSAARPIARETPSPGAARHVGMGACNRPRVLQSCRSTPDVGSSSSEEYRWSTSKD
jgi:hypothetical protein